jgi:hypothetical protein
MTRPQELAPLSAALRQAAAELAAHEPPPDLALRIRASLAQPMPAVPRQPRRQWARFALAASLALAAAGLLWHGGGNETAGPPASAVAHPADAAFVLVASEERWRRVAGAGAGEIWLVSAELPGERLAALGLPYDPGRAAERLPAQLLMHASGDVLAVRLMP